MSKIWKVTIIILVVIIIALIFIIGMLYKQSKDEINDINNEEAYIVESEGTTIGHKEIERKWLIDESSVPYNLESGLILKIEQTYICFSPEIRIRRMNNGDQFILGIKADMSVDGMIRDEFEMTITEEEYNNLLSKREKDAITINKIRYQIFEEGQALIIDIFENELEGLAYLEIEFGSEEAALAYNEPSWVIKDVTSDKRYKNQSLAQYGIPVDD